MDNVRNKDSVNFLVFPTQAVRSKEDKEDKFSLDIYELLLRYCLTRNDGMVDEELCISF